MQQHAELLEAVYEPEMRKEACDVDLNKLLLLLLNSAYVTAGAS